MAQAVQAVLDYEIRVKTGTILFQLKKTPADLKELQSIQEKVDKLVKSRLELHSSLKDLKDLLKTKRTTVTTIELALGLVVRFSHNFQPISDDTNIVKIASEEKPQQKSPIKGDLTSPNKEGVQKYFSEDENNLTVYTSGQIDEAQRLKLETSFNNLMERVTITLEAFDKSGVYKASTKVFMNTAVDNLSKALVETRDLFSTLNVVQVKPAVYEAKKS